MDNGSSCTTSRSAELLSQVPPQKSRSASASELILPLVTFNGSTTTYLQDPLQQTPRTSLGVPMSLLTVESLEPLSRQPKQREPRQTTKTLIRLGYKPTLRTWLTRLAEPRPRLARATSSLRSLERSRGSGLLRGTARNNHVHYRRCDGKNCMRID